MEMFRHLYILASQKVIDIGPRVWGKNRVGEGNPWAVCGKNSFKTFHDWLVVLAPLKNISQIGSSSQLLGKIKNVANHQPDEHGCLETFDPGDP